MESCMYYFCSVGTNQWHFFMWFCFLINCFVCVSGMKDTYLVSMTDAEHYLSFLHSLSDMGASMRKVMVALLLDIEPYRQLACCKYMYQYTCSCLERHLSIKAKEIHLICAIFTILDSVYKNHLLMKNTIHGSLEHLLIV